MKALNKWIHIIDRVQSNPLGFIGLYILSVILALGLLMLCACLIVELVRPLWL